MRRNGKEGKDRTPGRPQRKGQEVARRPWIFRGLDRNRVNQKNIIWGELIGLKAKIIRASHPELVGIEGYVLDETRNTLTIGGERVWVIPKDVAELEFEVGGKKIRINGKELIGRPEMRLKKRWRK
ncbi:MULTISPECIES: ribonuclease P protein component 1 [Thermococcus]|uniref:Ribonuclease P protein component 1 n=1 Tax=Thermococcus aciditolerans TaxID=2598455 RepID=A0A5C0SLY9_9EURY|nr:MULTISPECIES: ribonuclease P protein component 1 [Thermococcus]NJE00642.1 ribonuclease P protein component 1 [Thermococcus sp. JdF3]QEK14797.1 ribonuclease P protein component 1 [Thermococcus aciditolerans]